MASQRHTKQIFQSRETEVIYPKHTLRLLCALVYSSLLRVQKCVSRQFSDGFLTAGLLTVGAKWRLKIEAHGFLCDLE